MALSEMMVVRVPEPAIIGNAIGTMLSVFSCGSWRNKSIPKIISRAIIKITMLPATAKEETSIPNKLSRRSPITKNKTINIPAATVAHPESICAFFCRIPIMMGSAPSISITAKSVRLMVEISVKNYFMRGVFL